MHLHNFCNMPGFWSSEHASFWCQQHASLWSRGLWGNHTFQVQLSRAHEFSYALIACNPGSWLLQLRLNVLRRRLVALVLVPQTPLVAHLR